MKRNKGFFAVAVWALLFPLIFAFAALQTEKKSASEDEEFLSKARYILTKEETKAFRKLAVSEKQKFIEDFWKRRDPYPDTVENEFKAEYFNRIASADEFFHGEGRPGWLTERGRVYILYGPPDERQTSPLSAGVQGRCREVWYYRDFPVVFSDVSCSGNYMLATLDLSPIKGLLITNITGQPEKITQERSVVDFAIQLKQSLLEESRFEGVILIEVPYRKIWLEAAGDKLRTTLELQMELKDSQNILRWESKSSVDLVLTGEELAKNRDETYKIKVPLVVDRDVASLRLGKNKLTVILRNTTGKEEVRKVAEFNLKERSDE